MRLLVVLNGGADHPSTRFRVLQHLGIDAGLEAVARRLAAGRQAERGHGHHVGAVQRDQAVRRTHEMHAGPARLEIRPGAALQLVVHDLGDRQLGQCLVDRHLHRFDQTKKFSTWAYTIAGNLAKNELRNRSRNPLVLFQTIKKNWDADHRPLEWEDNTYRPDDLYRRRQLKAMIDHAVGQLPEHHRQVFVLREMEGKTYEEIAEVTGVNLGTVKSRLNRARNNFAQLIGPMLD